MPETPDPRAGGSMSLLVDMATAALDPEYRDAHTGAGRAAGRRTAGRRTPFGPVSFVLTGALLVAGLITGIAAAQVRTEEKQASAVRQSLLDDVRRQTAATDDLARDEAALRRDVAAIRKEALGQDDNGRLVSEQLAALELATGAVAVRGPGLLIEVDDAPAPETASEDGAAAGEGQIYDRDLQDVTNALWTAGAEHISINGLRLTALTTIRAAGEAVLVDFRPLSPPYVVRAIGDVDTMEPRFVDGPVARRFQTWTSLYGISFQVSRAKELRLPASGVTELRHVRMAPT